MEPTSSTSLIISKKTGALVFFVGCAIGLIISEIILSTATQRASDSAHQASVDYIQHIQSSADQGSFQLKKQIADSQSQTVEVPKERLIEKPSNVVLAPALTSSRKRRPKFTSVRQESESVLLLPIKTRVYSQAQIRKGTPDTGRLVGSDRKGHKVSTRLCSLLDDDNCTDNSFDKENQRSKRRVKRRRRHRKRFDAKVGAKHQALTSQDHTTPTSASKHMTLSSSSPISARNEKNPTDSKGHHQSGHALHQTKSTSEKAKLSKQSKSIQHINTTTPGGHHGQKLIEPKIRRNSTTRWRKVWRRLHRKKTTTQPTTSSMEQKQQDNVASVSDLNTPSSLVYYPEDILKSVSQKSGLNPYQSTTMPQTNLPQPLFDHHRKRSKSTQRKKDDLICQQMMHDLEAFEKDEKQKSEELMLVSFREGVDEVQSLIHTWIKIPVHILEGFTALAIVICLMLYWMEDAIQSKLRRVGFNI